jgi:hypothetical protein
MARDRRIRMKNARAIMRRLGGPVARERTEPSFEEMNLQAAVTEPTDAERLEQARSEQRRVDAIVRQMQELAERQIERERAAAERVEAAEEKPPP